MSKKIALITGANKGIGLETAKQLAKKGVTIILGARSEKNGNKAVNKLKEEGIDAEFLQLDVDNATQVQQAFEYINNRYGKLDILVNNAGIQIEQGDWGTNT